MRLAPFIEAHHEEIINEWVKYARDDIEGTQDLEQEEVRDHIKQMLDMIAENMEKAQTDEQQETKSKGNKNVETYDSNAANDHGGQRAQVGFDIVELSSEFRALRASVLRLWVKKGEAENEKSNFNDMIRFNEAIDELWMISLERFNTKMEESKNWLLAILSHDLRNPLAAILGVQSIMKLSPNLSEQEKAMLRISGSSVKRMDELINNLLELTNLRLGSGMTIKRSTVDLSQQAEKIIQELEMGYPHASLILKSHGVVEGEWDVVRLEQLITNLITNALRHGRQGGPVKISVFAEGNEAVFQVHNDGDPLPESIRKMIASGKYRRNGGDATKKDSYGLGLYIIKEIVDGHNGRIKVTSTQETGTTFKVNLPRQ